MTLEDAGETTKRRREDEKGGASGSKRKATKKKAKTKRRKHTKQTKGGLADPRGRPAAPAAEEGDQSSFVAPTRNSGRLYVSVPVDLLWMNGTSTGLYYDVVLKYNTDRLVWTRPVGGDSGGIFSPWPRIEGKGFTSCSVQELRTRLKREEIPFHRVNIKTKVGSFSDEDLKEYLPSGTMKVPLVQKLSPAEKQQAWPPRDDWEEVRSEGDATFHEEYLVAMKKEITDAPKLSERVVSDGVGIAEAKDMERRRLEEVEPVDEDARLISNFRTEQGTSRWRFLPRPSFKEQVQELGLKLLKESLQLLDPGEPTGAESLPIQDHGEHQDEQQQQQGEEQNHQQQQQQGRRHGPHAVLDHIASVHERWTPADHEGIQATEVMGCALEWLALCHYRGMALSSTTIPLRDYDTQQGRTPVFVDCTVEDVWASDVPGEHPFSMKRKGRRDGLEDGPMQRIRNAMREQHGDDAGKKLVEELVEAVQRDTRGADFIVWLKEIPTDHESGAQTASSPRSHFLFGQCKGVGNQRRNAFVDIMRYSGWAGVMRDNLQIPGGSKTLVPLVWVSNVTRHTQLKRVLQKQVLHKKTIPMLQTQHGMCTDDFMGRVVQGLHWVRTWYAGSSEGAGVAGLESLPDLRRLQRTVIDKIKLYLGTEQPSSGGDVTVTDDDVDNDDGKSNGEGLFEEEDDDGDDEEREVVRIQLRLRGPICFTITMFPGAGKTRVAYEIVCRIESCARFARCQGLPIVHFSLGINLTLQNCKSFMDFDRRKNKGVLSRPFNYVVCSADQGSISGGNVRIVSARDVVGILLRHRERGELSKVRFFSTIEGGGAFWHASVEYGNLISNEEHETEEQDDALFGVVIKDEGHKASGINTGVYTLCNNVSCMVSLTTTGTPRIEDKRQKKIRAAATKGAKKEDKWIGKRLQKVAGGSGVGDVGPDESDQEVLVLEDEEDDDKDGVDSEYEGAGSDQNSMSETEARTAQNHDLFPQEPYLDARDPTTPGDDEDPGVENIMDSIGLRGIQLLAPDLLFEDIPDGFDWLTGSPSKLACPPSLALYSELEGLRRSVAEPAQ